MTGQKTEVTGKVTTIKNNNNKRTSMKKTRSTTKHKISCFQRQPFSRVMDPILSRLLGHDMSVNVIL